MVNTSEFSRRLQQIMDYYGLTASAFADSLEIQRSGISHLLSERNKPSLDFILKLVDTYPEVDIYWITKGEGAFPPVSVLEETIKTTENKEVKSSIQMDLFNDLETLIIPKKSPEIAEEIPQISEKNIENNVPKATKRIKKIIFFYENNQFEIFENE